MQMVLETEKLYRRILYFSIFPNEEIFQLNQIWMSYVLCIVPFFRAKKISAKIIIEGLLTKTL